MKNKGFHFRSPFVNHPVQNYFNPFFLGMNAFTEQPPYTAILLFELKKNCNGTPIIDIYYQTSQRNPPKEIMRNVPYKQFKDQLKPITVDPTSWNNECRTGFVF